MATSIRATTESRAGVGSVTAAGTATLHLQQLQDTSWVGNLAWSGRTLQDGGTEAELVVRRFAARLAALPGGDRPERMKLIRVSQSGEREEREADPLSAR